MSKDKKKKDNKKKEESSVKITEKGRRHLEEIKKRSKDIIDEEYASLEEDVIYRHRLCLNISYVSFQHKDPSQYKGDWLGNLEIEFKRRITEMLNQMRIRHCQVDLKEKGRIKLEMDINGG